MSLAHHLISACRHLSSAVRYDYSKIRMSSSRRLSWQPVITHRLGRSRRLWSYVSTRWGGWHTPPVFILSHIKHVCSYNYKNSIMVKKSMLYPATRNSAHLSFFLWHYYHWQLRWESRNIMAASVSSSFLYLQLVSTIINWVEKAAIPMRRLWQWYCLKWLHMNCDKYKK